MPSGDGEAMAFENPFKPTAGKQPPILLGREEPIEEFIEGISDGAGAAGRLMRISGARGTGKTVLLKRLCDIAENQGWNVVRKTADPGVAEDLRLWFWEKQPGIKLPSGISPKVEMGPIGVSLTDNSLKHQPRRLRDAAEQYYSHGGKPVMIALDEVQDMPSDELREVAVTVQNQIVEDRDIILVLAGLPGMVKLITEGKTLTFLRRATAQILDRVPLDDVSASYAAILFDEQVKIEPAILEELAAATAGYPFMVQLVGHEAWAAARNEYGIVEEIGPEAAKRGIAKAVKKFEGRVIEPALDSLSPADLAYLLKLHELGGTAESRAVAEALGLSITQASPRRSHLINDGLIEAPSHGRVSISMPYLGIYLDQHPDVLG